ncbi:MAG: hypothetical protein Pg6A_19710 [Termitinemataceae bacterium]|nr:MAG: hypothetical protein Pg6A_19710 [Termitinemataceae bacterium]
MNVNVCKKCAEHKEAIQCLDVPWGEPKKQTPIQFCMYWNNACAQVTSCDIWDKLARQYV